MVLLHGRWKLVILWHIHAGIGRFGELRRHIPGIAEKMLTTQLRELERDGFVTRQAFAEVPLRVEYTLRPLATSLIPILQQLFVWGQEHDAVGRVRQHYLSEVGASVAQTFDEPPTCAPPSAGR